MYRPSRARRIFKWTGLAASLLMLPLWLKSIGYSYFIPLGGQSAVGFDSARFVAKLFANFDIRRVISPPYQYEFICVVNFGFEWPVFMRREPVFNQGTTTDSYSLTVLPFWLVLLMIGIPTAWLWHRDRRRIRPGCCMRCGYDLTGNTSGVCPECGDKVYPPAVLAELESGLAKPPAAIE